MRVCSCLVVNLERSGETLECVGHFVILEEDSEGGRHISVRVRLTELLDEVDQMSDLLVDGSGVRHHEKGRERERERERERKLSSDRRRR